MSEAMLVLNAGSSSLKFSLYIGPPRPTAQRLLYSGGVRGIGGKAHFFVVNGAGKQVADRDLTAADAAATQLDLEQNRPRSSAYPANPLHQQAIEVPSHEVALHVILDWLAQQHGIESFSLVGHRVVHGGAAFTGPQRINDAVMAQLKALVPLAPLHQPHPLAAIEAISRRFPNAPQIACFDTSFHLTQSRLATSYALPRELGESGIRRYGFHGLSYGYIASVLPNYLGDRADGRVIVAHLGAGASLCAMHGRQSVATTMGFTALDGLMMATRSGSIDPGVILYLMQEKGMSAEQVNALLYHRSGLLGVSGISADMQTLLDSRDAHAAEAVDLFVYRITREIGSLAAAMGGLDALIFTAGIGEHSALIRERVCQGAEWLGVRLDPIANQVRGYCIHAVESKVSVWVIPTDEDLLIAQQSWDLLTH